MNKNIDNNQIDKKNEQLPLLDVKNLKVTYNVSQGSFGKSVKLRAVDDVSFALNNGEVLGIVGESGCGKSSLIRALLLLLPTENIKAKNISWHGKNMLFGSAQELKNLRKYTSMVFQDPLASLNPRMNIGEIIGEPLCIHFPKLTSKEISDKVDQAMDLVGLNKDMKYRYPHEFSGGQNQRVGIARAIVLNPKVVVCDEAVSALDVSIKAQIINLLKDLKQTLGISFLFVSHDLAIVEYISDRVMVLYLGEMMELADSQSIYQNPLHPYTQMLISSIPIADPVEASKRPLKPMQGEIPSVLHKPKGCAFASRCPKFFEECHHKKPTLKKVNKTLVACHLY